MKYIPRNSNFVDMQDEFADELASGCRTYLDGLEAFKDVVAKYIDSYLDAIIKEHLEERKFFAYCNGKNPVVMFMLGENKLPDGQVDGFYTERPLSDLLDEIGAEVREVEEAEDAAAVALMFESVAAKFREREKAIPTEQAEWEKRYAERVATTPPSA
jgi:hypothetical protein